MGSLQVTLPLHNYQVSCLLPLAMDIYERLRANRDKLLETYRTNLEEILNLQATLIRDILPSVTGELNLSPDATEWAREWLSDTSSIFRIARRNKFTTSFALESIRKNLVWRLSTLWPPVAPINLPNVHILPAHARDPFGRPTIVVEVMEFAEDFEVQKRLIFQAFEQCRQHLQDLHNSSDANEEPPLQYIVLCDLKKVSYQSLRLDVLTWTLREVIPRFPGMLAGVFMLNYSWAHSGVWNVVKHLLPEAALSRVFFPTQVQLTSYFTPSALPQEYGGSLLSLTDTEGPSQTGEGPSPLHFVLPISEPIPSTATKSSVSSISPTSLLNPFFGYPVSSLSSPSRSPSFPHGRRRKRDLARTLIWLLWLRWRSYITFGLCLITLALTINFAIRKRRLGSLRNFFKWRQ